MNRAEPLSVKVARRWTAVYTRGLPIDERERRCLELESDLWEHLHDHVEPNAARAVFGRLLRGIPADVRWRYRTLLDSRGARQRSRDMKTTPRSAWWVILTALLGLVPLGITIAMWASGVGGGGPYRLVGVSVAALMGVLLIGGLVRRRTNLVGGSKLIAAGAALTLFGGFEFLPIGIIVLVTGFWTGNLELSESADDDLDLHPVRDQQVAMTRHWFNWLGVAALFFAIGWLPLVMDDPNDPNDLSAGGWMAWVLAWFAAIITASVGLILAGLRLAVRHRTRLS